MPAIASPHALRAKIRLSTEVEGERGHPAKALPIGPAALDAVLPDGGLPRGAVVEIASPLALGRGTTVALRACAAAQAEARLRGGGARSTGGAWCAFVDPWATLHAPAVALSGVDLARLLVVRPPVDAIARVVVRLAESRVFAVIAVDTSGAPGAGSAGAAPSVRLDRWITVVRRLALAVERTDTTVLLLTGSRARPAWGSMPLPVAMRIELAPAFAPASRAKGPPAPPPAIARPLVKVLVAKERHGRVGAAAVVAV